MNAHPLRLGRQGVTLIELLIAMLITGLVLAAALSLLHQQGVAFMAGTDHAQTLQNHRYAVSAIERDLRIAGLSTRDDQPRLVYAGPGVISFNGNHTSNFADDVSAAFIDPDAPDEAVTAMRAANAITLPGTGFVYPAEDFPTTGAESYAETITLYFEVDPFEDGLWALMRRTNHLEPEVIARGFRPLDGRDFFEYFLEQEGGAPERRAPPFDFTTEDDAGRVAERVRLVRVNFEAVGPPTAGAEPIVRRVSRTVLLPNTGQRELTRCGEAPSVPGDFQARHRPDPADGFSWVVELTWSPSVDETGDGQGDVQRYAMWRRAPGAEWPVAPFRSVGIGQSAYVQYDETVAPGEAWEYRLGVQDCTPTWSYEGPQVVNIPPADPGGGGGPGGPGGTP